MDPVATVATVVDPVAVALADVFNAGIGGLVTLGAQVLKGALTGLMNSTEIRAALADGLLELSAKLVANTQALDANNAAADAIARSRPVSVPTPKPDPAHTVG